ncbi:sulfatase-like hydrolase/transferase [Ruegeria arenilitoris]|uniref:sulfatase-like hydrolase/transferase n=1 Tax=Ruegeria arenilitoris TaxID=1173585 RepID=UPI00147F4BD8|nr:sulfatase-like hydrolase/transferase [Ruegeria arenilitoris]
MAQEKKNIVLITVDDGGAYSQYREAFGAPLHLPNLDRIAEDSAAFDSAYCQAPICGPSRNSLMSGLSPYQTGILDNYTNLFDVLRPEQLWQFKLKQRGYYCSTAGKVHHSFAPLPRPMHDILYSHPPHPLRLGPPQSVPVRRFGGLTGGAGTTDPAHDSLYYDHQSATDAVEFLETYDGAAPFYREIGFHHPHIPFKTPEAFKRLYNEQDFQIPEAWNDGFDTTGYPDRFMGKNMDLRDAAYWRKSVRNYFSAYSHVDSQIGRIWAALKSSRHADNTVLIFTSDHGYHLGDKGRMRKFTLWEESCRVPLIIHDPDAQPRQVRDPVALLDVGPTILDYAGCPPMHSTISRSLKDMTHGTSDPERAVPTFLYGNTSMRKGAYRITLYQNGESEFHNVQDDPWLTKNLAGKHPDYAKWRQDLSQVCVSHGLILPDAEGSAAPFHVSFTDTMDPPKAGSVGAIGSLDASPDDIAPTAPGARVHYSTLNHDGTAALPDGFARMHYGADASGGVNRFVATGNQQDNEFLFPGSVNRFQLTVHPGPGKNRITVQNDDLVVYCGEGENSILAANANCVLYGGTGKTTMTAGKGFARMVGDSGDTTMIGGHGPVSIVTGSGCNRITGGHGDTQITLAEGSNDVTLRSATTTLTIQRTGLPQKIQGFQGGKIDLSDWASLGQVRVRQSEDDTILSCGTERVVFAGVPQASLLAAICGLEIA